MTREEAEKFIVGKVCEINDIYYHFNYGGKLLITSTNPPIEGIYSISQAANRCYLKTDPEIVLGKKELFLDLILDERIILLDE
jgi:hypothetical protein